MRVVPLLFHSTTNLVPGKYWYLWETLNVFIQYIASGIVIVNTPKLYFFNAVADIALPATANLDKEIS